MAENSTITARRRGVGRPFKKGQSGNPGGRPKVAEKVKALVARNTTKAVERIVTLLDSRDERVALQAAKEILDRAWGKSVQASDVTMNVELTPAAILETIRRNRERGN